MKKKLYEYEYTQGPIFVSGKYEEGEHRLFLGNKNSPMVLASMNPVHTQTPGNARRLVASWNACLPYEIDDLEELGSVGVCTLRLSLQRDKLVDALERIEKYGAQGFKGDYTQAQIAKNALAEFRGN